MSELKPTKYQNIFGNIYETLESDFVEALDELTIASINNKPTKPGRYIVDNSGLISSATPIPTTVAEVSGRIKALKSVRRKLDKKIHAYEVVLNDLECGNV